MKIANVKVYLAGGFHGNWQNHVKENLSSHFLFFDPLYNALNPDKTRKELSFAEYTTLDLHGIKTSDVVFVYSERTNPGQGYIVEAGYAKGLGKTVILVREPNNEHMPDKYLNFIDCVADIVFETLDEGIKFLSKF